MFSVVYVLYVHLASNEWGSPKMEEIAKELFAKDEYKNKKPMCIHVYEHAGWYLVYTIIDNQLTIVGSANDTAKWSEKIQEWRDNAFYAKWESLGTIRREPV